MNATALFAFMGLTHTATPELRQELLATVRHELGVVAIEHEGSVEEARAAWTQLRQNIGR